MEKKKIEGASFADTGYSYTLCYQESAGWESRVSIWNED
jgi:hypothetical protein